MPSKTSGNVVLLRAAAAALRDDFIGWQCRVRQLCVRQLGGKPTPAMRPRVLTVEGDLLSAGVTLLLNESDPAKSISLFRHQFQKTNDPIERYEKILEILAGTFFQHPAGFSDVMTGLFGGDSTITARLLTHGRCVLEFEEYSQAYRLPCMVSELAHKDPHYQVTYWHNRMFNPNLPPGIRILSFAPDWTHAESLDVDQD